MSSSDWGAEGGLARGLFDLPGVGLREVRRFEATVASICESTWALGVNSASSGLWACGVVLGLTPGDEVLVPSLSWPQTWAPFSRLGVRSIPIDCAVDWPVMDPARLAATITPRTRAVLSVGLWGSPAGLAEIHAVCRRARVPHVLDAAQLWGATVEGRGLGTLADLVVLSFGPTKPLLALGGGGAILGRTAQLFDRLLALTQHPLRVPFDAKRIVRPSAQGRSSWTLSLHPAAAAYGSFLLANSERWRVPVPAAVEVRTALATSGAQFIEPPAAWRPGASAGGWVLVEALDRDGRAWGGRMLDGWSWEGGGVQAWSDVRRERSRWNGSGHGKRGNLMGSSTRHFTPIARRWRARIRPLRWNGCSLTTSTVIPTTNRGDLRGAQKLSWWLSGVPDNLTRTSALGSTISVARVFGVPPTGAPTPGVWGAEARQGGAERPDTSTRSTRITKKKSKNRKKGATIMANKLHCAGCGNQIPSKPYRTCSNCGAPFHWNHGVGNECQKCRKGYSR